MARKIKETPILYGSDAVRFLNIINSSEVNASEEDRAFETLQAKQKKELKSEK